jgi:SWI/SNF-related matrix-associated actin-dependent regulator of chromatin subfamily A member 5
MMQKRGLNMGMLSLAKRERKTNYSVDGYFKETMRAGPSKPDKPAKMPKAPKQVNINDFQFFPPRLAELQERELNYWKVWIDRLFPGDGVYTDLLLERERDPGDDP